MLSRPAAVFGMKVVLMKLMLFGIEVNSGPTEKREEMTDITGETSP